MTVSRGMAIRYQVLRLGRGRRSQVRRLRDKGSNGHRPAMTGATWTGRFVVVVSSAVKRDNPELLRRRVAAPPVVRRARVAELMMRLKRASRSAAPWHDHPHLAGRALIGPP